MQISLRNKRPKKRETVNELVYKGIETRRTRRSLAPVLSPERRSILNCSHEIPRSETVITRVFAVPTAAGCGLPIFP